MKLVFVLMVAVLLAGCNTKRETTVNESKPANEKSDESVVQQDQQNPDSTSDGVDSVLVPGFGVEVRLSDRATERLHLAKETIIVSAYFSGEPKEGVQANVNEMGEVSLNSVQLEIKEPGIARFDKVHVSRKDLELLSDPDFRVSINVFSGRHSTNLNLLDCDILEQPISQVKGRVHVLAGRLIEEEN